MQGLWGEVLLSSQQALRGVGVWKEPGMPWPELLAWKIQSHPSGLTNVGLLASGKLGGQQPHSGEEGRSQSSGDAR